MRLATFDLLRPAEAYGVGGLWPTKLRKERTLTNEALKKRSWWRLTFDFRPSTFSFHLSTLTLDLIPQSKPEHYPWETYIIFCKLILCALCVFFVVVVTWSAPLFSHHAHQEVTTGTAILMSRNTQNLYGIPLKRCAKTMPFWWMHRGVAKGAKRLLPSSKILQIWNPHPWALSPWAANKVSARAPVEHILRYSTE